MNVLSEPPLEVELEVGAAAARLTPQAIRAARARAAREQRSVCAVLEDELALPPELLLQALGRRMQHPVQGSASLSMLTPAFDAIGYADAARRGCLAFREHGELIVVVSDPFDDALQAWCDERIGAPHELRLATADDIAAVLSRHEDSMRAIDTALPAEGSAEAASGGLEDLSIRSIGEGTSIVVKLVHSTLYDALKSGVSDIHVEANLTGLVIKYRLDGTLTQVGAIDGRELAEQVLSRLKVMSELDIAERRVPQDGRFRVKALGREIDFRVSIMPSIHGEDAVVRVLDKQSLADQVSGLRLDVLGFDASILATFRRMARDPYGLLLVTGPTGSGKTASSICSIFQPPPGMQVRGECEDSPLLWLA